MSSYIIAGSSDKFDTSECENLANVIQRYYPGISFKIVLKDQSEWELYVDEISRIYGFKVKSNPIVYTIDGKLIGDRIAFLQLAESRFGIANPKLRQGPITPDINKVCAREELDAKIKIQKQKKTLKEKIDEQTLRLYSQKVVKPMEGYFNEKFVHGMNFLYKFEDRLCPPYHLKREFKDETEEEVILDQDTVLAEVTNEEGKKEVKQVAMFTDNFMTIEYQQFLIQQQQQSMLQQQILLQEQQKILEEQNELEEEGGQAQVTNQDEEEKKERIKTEELDKSNQEEIGATEENKKTEEEQNQDQQQDEHQEEGQNQNQQGEEQNEELLRPESAPMQIDSDEVLPETIKINDYIVHKFRNGYALVHHPASLVDGQYVLLQPKVEEESILMLDYSRVKRGRFNSFKAQQRKNSDITNVNINNGELVEGLYENKLDIYRSITELDIQIIVKLITKIDAIASINILPQDLCSFLPLSNGHINILLRSFFQLYQKNVKLLQYLTQQQEYVQNLLPIEEFVINQKSKYQQLGKNVYKIKNLDIIHFFSIPEKILTPEQTQDNIQNLFKTFLEKEPNAPLKMGYNLIISKNLIFMCPIFNNYDEINGVKLHLPSLATLGILNMPLMNGKETNIEFFELLKKTQKHYENLKQQK